MGMAPVAHVLFNKFMTFNPKNPNWVNRDRFVLSYVPIAFFKLLLAVAAVTLSCAIASSRLIWLRLCSESGDAVQWRYRILGIWVSRFPRLLSFGDRR